jgi:hypothetical protein
VSNLSPKFTPTTFDEARRLHEKHGDTTLCYATKFVKVDESAYSIIHHQTVIVTWFDNGKILLSGDGWASRTTADRMHRFTPHNVRVSARQGTLTVTLNDRVIGNATYGLVLSP